MKERRTGRAESGDRAQASLDGNIEDLRRSLSRVEPSPEVGAALAHFARAHPRERSHATPVNRWSLAAAAAVVLGLALVWDHRPYESDAVPSQDLAGDVSMSASEQRFMPLSYGVVGDEFDQFTVIRVKLDRIALLQAGITMPISASRGFVDADLLIGIDGTVVGIRFLEQPLPRAVSRPDQNSEEESI